MPAYTIAFDVARVAPTSVQHVTRDFGISAGDDFTLQIRAYEQDGDVLPISMSSASGSVSLWQLGDISAALTVDGIVALPSSAGRINFSFAPADTSSLSGRYLWMARINVSGESVVVRGAVNIREAVGVAALTLSAASNLLLLEDGGGIIVESGNGFLVLEG